MNACAHVYAYTCIHGCVCVDADASLGDRVPCVLYGHSQLKGDELDQVEVMSFNEN